MDEFCKELEKVIKAGIGAVATCAEKAQEAVENLAQKGEPIFEQAKEKANAVTKAVYSAIGDTAVKIDDLSQGIGEIARNFTKSVEEVELRIKALTGDMSKTAQALISENVLTEEIKTETIEVAKEYDFSAPVVDEEITFDSKIGDEDY